MKFFFYKFLLDIIICHIKKNNVVEHNLKKNLYGGKTNQKKTFFHI